MEIKEETMEQDLEQETICRICFSSEKQELITPCKCKGTQQFIHKQCLKLWQERIRTNTCSVCQTEFNVQLSQRTRKRRNCAQNFFRVVRNKILRMVIAILLAFIFFCWPLKTLATIGGIFLVIPTILAIYWIYYYFRGIVITPQIENGRIRILFMRQGAPVSNMRPGMLLRGPDSGGEIFRNATVLI